MIDSVYCGLALFLLDCYSIHVYEAVKIRYAIRRSIGITGRTGWFLINVPSSFRDEVSTPPFGISVGSTLDGQVLLLV